MKVRQLHRWDVSISEAQDIQRKLAGQLVLQNHVTSVRLVGGTDISGADESGEVHAAVVVLDYPSLDVVDMVVIAGKPTFPYVPGLLSFREIPLLLPALEALNPAPDLMLVDGQGTAHPRRLGLASHLGLLMDIPTVGCAKSRLFGRHGPVAGAAGSWTEMTADGDVVGAAVRTRTGVSPVYVSPGNRVDLVTAVQWVLKCCRGYRVPETTRKAHLAAAGGIKLKDR